MRKIIIPISVILLVLALLVVWSSCGSQKVESPDARSNQSIGTTGKSLEPVETFEQRRSRVDRDPAFYESKAKENPVTAEDHYLLGRAYVLIGLMTSAKNSFDKAGELVLTEGYPANPALPAEIAFGRTATSSEKAFIEFRKKFLALTEKEREEKKKREAAAGNQAL